MQEKHIIGIDLGATNIRGGLVTGKEITNTHAKPIRSKGTVEEVLQDIFDITDLLVNENVAGIGIGVPSVVNLAEGIVYDVQHIPSWKEVPLKKRMEERYHLPVFVNNDANCFALGEYYFGKGIGSDHMIGLTLGTGIGAGVIINRHLYAGPNCGAGEFGMVDYLDHNYEYYGSGQFFSNVYQTDGQVVFERAQAGDPQALQWYAELGTHLGNTVKLILYAYDPPLIVFGGSVRHAYPYFQETMWERINTFAFTKSLPGLRIELSELQNSGILGAAGLYYDAVK
ncbi:ROK family protein [Flavihumibacter profundi]|jgi:glucokinase|uniref:ROK family protein n=1 Tax=Flavihumibacter profundi TaxID=2716883 RepID=UPI001CC41478|nr:ROK family protein [Flavihumibacter profundi]MBZ5858270.1 ROK family protein [Flavihumibacter profundi]